MAQDLLGVMNGEPPERKLQLLSVVIPARDEEGCVASAANGKAGASAVIGPISRTMRFTMPRAGRPVNTLVSVVLLSFACFSAVSHWPQTRTGLSRPYWGSGIRAVEHDVQTVQPHFLREWGVQGADRRER